MGEQTVLNADEMKNDKPRGYQTELNSSNSE